jgi:CheY-like chemotaxis protein
LANPRVLIVDDDDAVRLMLEEALKRDGCEVVGASTVRDALRSIATENFDILLSDLHMPQAGDGFTVVSAMRHTHPQALTVVLSGYPALDEAMAAIMSQADEVLTKPVSVPDLRKLMKEKLGLHEVRKVVKMESVASILERSRESTISNWLALVEKDPELIAIPMTSEARTGHLPRLLADIIIRLRLPPDSVMKPSSAGARPRTIAAGARLQRTHGDSGIEGFAGEHFLHSAREPAQRRLQQGFAGCSHHRR